MNTIDEMIEVLQAVRDGKEIEYLSEPSIISCGTWKPSTVNLDYLPDFREITYRVKPQKKELWCVYNRDNFIIAYYDRENAEYYIDEQPHRANYTIIHMVEGE